MTNVVRPLSRFLSYIHDAHHKKSRKKEDVTTVCLKLTRHNIIILHALQNRVPKKKLNPWEKRRVSSSLPTIHTRTEGGRSASQPVDRSKSSVNGVITVVRAVVETACNRVYERRYCRRSLLLRLSSSFRCGGVPTSIQSRVGIVVQVANVQGPVNGVQQPSNLVRLREERDVVVTTIVVGVVRGRPDHGNIYEMPPPIIIIITVAIVVVVETGCHGDGVVLWQGKRGASGKDNCLFLDKGCPLVIMLLLLLFVK